MAGTLDGKVTVITGGASGIGEATVRLFAAEGARVVIADIQDQPGEALARGIGANAVYQHTDVSREDDVRGAIDRALKEFGALDVMFNNAGSLGAVGPIAETTADDFERTMGVLLRGVFFGIKHAAGIMQPKGAGSIISTASIAGIQPGWGPHLYAAMKAAVIQLTRTTALELGESGVRVNCICPGGIVTPLIGSLGGARQVPLDDLKVGMAKSQPIQRAGLPEDVAQAALWLASEGASFVTGEALVVDGGMALGPLWSRQTPAFTQRRQQ
jgi:NAD(P)-dependent dehydrogenase (short-subunit alcohol dehydrogenase family)